MDDHQQKLVKLLDLFVEQVHNKFNKYAFYFFLCELLNIIITVIMVRVKKADKSYPNFFFLRFGLQTSSFTTNTLITASTFTSITGLNTDFWDLYFGLVIKILES